MTNQAKNRPANSPSQEVYTADMAMTQPSDIDFDSPIVHGEALANLGEENKMIDGYKKMLAFMEEAVTVRIEGNGRDEECPETHVPVAVNGVNAQVMINGQWLSIGWLPIGEIITTKRKFVEVLMRSQPETIRTVHDEATIDKPRNTQSRQKSRKYPLTIIKDSAEGIEWSNRVNKSF